MRERLIELMQEKCEVIAVDNGEFIETTVNWQEIADHLLANGVIVLPCKLRDTVYCIRYDKAKKPFIKPLEVLSITLFHTGDFALFTTKEDILGKTVFLTREEAENALAEMIKGGEG